MGFLKANGPYVITLNKDARLATMIGDVASLLGWDEAYMRANPCFKWLSSKLPQQAQQDCVLASAVRSCLADGHSFRSACPLLHSRGTAEEAVFSVSKHVGNANEVMATVILELREEQKAMDHNFAVLQKRDHGFFPAPTPEVRESRARAPGPQTVLDEVLAQIADLKKKLNGQKDVSALLSSVEKKLTASGHDLDNVDLNQIDGDSEIKEWLLNISNPALSGDILIHQRKRKQDSEELARWCRGVVQRIALKAVATSVFARMYPHAGVVVLEKQHEVVVTEVHPDRPAAIAGILVNDVVLAVDRTPVHSMRDFGTTIARLVPGGIYTWKVRRNTAAKIMTAVVSRAEYSLASVKQISVKMASIGYTQHQIAKIRRLMDGVEQDGLPLPPLSKARGSYPAYLAPSLLAEVQDMELRFSLHKQFVQVPDIREPLDPAAPVAPILLRQGTKLRRRSSWAGTSEDRAKSAMTLSLVLRGEQRDAFKRIEEGSEEAEEEGAGKGEEGKGEEGTEVGKGEEGKPEESKGEEGKAEQSKAEESKAEESKADDSKAADDRGEDDEGSKRALPPRTISSRLASNSKGPLQPSPSAKWAKLASPTNGSRLHPNDVPQWHKGAASLDSPGKKKGTLGKSVTKSPARRPPAPLVVPTTGSRSARSSIHKAPLDTGLGRSPREARDKAPDDSGATSQRPSPGASPPLSPTQFPDSEDSDGHSSRGSARPLPRSFARLRHSVAANVAARMLAQSRDANKTEEGDTQSVFILQTILNSEATELLQLNENIHQWTEFDIFRVGELTGGRPLQFVVQSIFRNEGLVGKHGISQSCLNSFCAAIEQAYLHNPYHNSTHGADVLQAVYSVVKNSRLGGDLTSLEQVGLYLASAVHDVAHPGVTNAYLINSRDALALCYNDTTVLESFHVSVAFYIMQQPDNDVLAGLDWDEYRDLRKLIIDLVRATDMAEHFVITALYERKLANEGDFGQSLVDRAHVHFKEHRLLFLQMLLKCGDLSHPARATALHVRWTHLITQEFFAQGDSEREMELPLSMFMDRHTTDLRKSQTGFLSFIVFPLWKGFAATPLPAVGECALECVDNVNANYGFWQAVAEGRIGREGDRLAEADDGDLQSDDVTDQFFFSLVMSERLECKGSGYKYSSRRAYAGPMLAERAKNKQSLDQRAKGSQLPYREGNPDCNSDDDRTF